MLDITDEQLTAIYRAYDFRIKELKDAGWDLHIFRMPDVLAFRWTATHEDGRVVNAKYAELGRRDCVKAAWRKLVQETRS
jgi:uncharacterized protein (UPF0128 family)